MRVTFKSPVYPHMKNLSSLIHSHIIQTCEIYSVLWNIMKVSVSSSKKDIKSFFWSRMISLLYSLSAIHSQIIHKPLYKETKYGETSVTSNFIVFCGSCECHNTSTINSYKVIVMLRTWTVGSACGKSGLAVQTPVLTLKHHTLMWTSARFGLVSVSWSCKRTSSDHESLLFPQAGRLTAVWSKH